jgi:hypothetical protein
MPPLRGYASCVMLSEVPIERNSWTPMRSIEDLENQACSLKLTGDYPSALALRIELARLLSDAPPESQARNFNWISYLERS